MFGPLTNDIVCDDDLQDGYADKANEEYEVGITVSRLLSVRSQNK